MRELRTQESDKFRRFFQLVREKADEEKSIFFVDCGEGRPFESDEMEGEDLSGWMIPKDRAEDFQKEFDANDVSEEWDDFMKFVKWERIGQTITILTEDF